MPGRLVSLDVFRGLTVALMILVNNPGSWAHVYAPLRHARWHGWTPTDLVFPFFLFAVGVAVSLSFSRRVEQGAARRDLLAKILRRTAIIFALGLFLNGFPFTGGAEQWAGLRIMGVLQRIALCYLAVALTVVLVEGKTGRAVIGLVWILIYELGMRLPLLDGWGAGSFALEDSFVRGIDLVILGEAHLYQGSGIPFDPEGLWSTWNAAVTTLLGFFTGEFLRRGADLRGKTRALVLWGMGLAVLGQGLHWLEPVNKQLWTTSYVVLTTGLAHLVLAVSIWVIDLQGWDRLAKPAIVFGSNALVVFVGSGIMARALVLIRVPGENGHTTSLKTWIFAEGLASWAGQFPGSLLFAGLFVLVWLGILWILYNQKIFIKA